MKQELKTADTAFCTTCTRPLYKQDREAYSVRIKVENDSERVQVTALRSDGITVTGIGSAADESGYSEYCLTHDMYSVAGKLILKVAVVSGSSIITVRQIECTVREE